MERGIELLRDDGLRYNPDNVLIYRELAWIFQHKMGAEPGRRQRVLQEPMGQGNDAVFRTRTERILTRCSIRKPPRKGPTPLLLREKFKIDPVFAEKVDEEWGPLDWRLPEAHAIYWGALGLDAAKKNPDKVKADDLIMLRRIIYQSMQQAFYHGRIIANPYTETYSLGPNLDLAEKANDSYLKNYGQETQPNQKEGILRAHRNFLRDAVYFLYENYRLADAAKWYKVLSEKYPDKPVLDGDPTSFPKTMTPDEYAVRRVQLELNDTSQERTTAVVQGLLQQCLRESGARFGRPLSGLY